MQPLSRADFDLVSELHRARSEATDRRVSMQAWAHSARRLLDAPLTSPTQIETWRAYVQLLLSEIASTEEP